MSANDFQIFPQENKFTHVYSQIFKNLVTLKIVELTGDI